MPWMSPLKPSSRRGTLLVIGVIEVRRYLMGRATLQESMKGMGRWSARAITYHMLGAALGATGLGIVSIPIVTGVRVAESPFTGAVDLADNLVTRTDDLNVLEFAPYPTWYYWGPSSNQPAGTTLQLQVSPTPRTLLPG